MPGPGVGGVCSRGCLVWCLVPGGCAPGGVPGPGGSAPRGVPGGDPQTATAAGGTHPTGMHSCVNDHNFMCNDRISLPAVISDVFRPFVFPFYLLQLVVFLP